MVGSNCYLCTVLDIYFIPLIASINRAGILVAVECGY